MKLSVSLTQSPVVLQPVRSNDNHTSTLTGQVTISTRRQTIIHGLEVVWEVLYQTREEVNDKARWSREGVLEKYTASVLEGRQMVREGETTFVFLIQVPSGLLPTRTTQYDRITHALHAAVLSPAPRYGQKASGSRSASGSFVSQLGMGIGSSSNSRNGPWEKSQVVMTCRRDMDVFSASSTEARHTHFTWKEKIEALGDLEVVATTEALALAAPVEMHATLSTLPPQVRIHAVTIELCQRTQSADSAKFYEDRYTLLSAGSVHAAPGAQPLNSEGTFYHLDGAFHLPSPVIGALATSSALTKTHPVARISHSIETSVHYLLDGDEATGAGEAAAKLRLWTGSRSITLESDIPSTYHNPPPPYVKEIKDESASPTSSSSENGSARSSGEPVDEINATKVPHWTSVQFFDHYWMRPVKLEPHILRKSTRQHWEETGGLCRCFDGAGVEGIGGGPLEGSVAAMRVKV